MNTTFGLDPVSDGDEPATGAEPADAPAGKLRTAMDPRVLRVLLTGAAAVAVLGTASAGFLWLSTPPAGEEAVTALGGARSTPELVDPVRATGVAFSGNDLFATTAAPTSADADAPTTAVAGAPAAATARTSPAAVPAPAGVPRTGVTAPGRPGSAAVPTAPPSAPGVPAPGVPAPGVPVPGVVAPPVPSAPGWVAPAVTFVEGTDAAGTFELAGERITVAKGQRIYPLSVVFGGVVVESKPSPSPSPSSESATPSPSTPSPSTTEAPKLKAVLLAAGHGTTGWILAPGTALPDAVVGATSGRVRVEAVLRDQFWVAVDRRPAVLRPKGAGVAETPLVFTGDSNAEFDRWAAQSGTTTRVFGQVFFTGPGSVVSFGRFGGGEFDGVSF